MSYQILITPFIALILAQIIKVIIDSMHGKFSWTNFNRYGGMPSSHAALMGAFLVEIGAAEGYTSAAFVIAAVLAFVVLRDAVGLRYALGKHAKLINMLVSDLPDYKEGKYPFLDERLGHTYTQLTVGLILGIIIAVIL